jgi:predicted ATPase
VRLISFQLKNYKSYIDSGLIELGPGINVIVGKNNAGKSALIETLIPNFPFGPKPHRSLVTKRTSTDLINPISSKHLTVELTGAELRKILLEHGSDFAVPMPEGAQPGEGPGRSLLKDLFQRSSIKIALMAEAGGHIKAERIPSFDSFQSTQATRFAARADRSDFKFLGAAQATHNPELGTVVGTAFVANSYTFRAERYNVAECGYGGASQLTPDASNLPQVLNVLQGNNPSRFLRFNELVRQIFPTIQRITVKPNPANSNLQVLVWTNHPDLERDDLAISLNECGTGVGQVLAILYVAINSAAECTIVIDEPNTFLHPGAVRTLMEILRSFPLQQFIISTHSSEVIRASQPSSLSFIKWNDGVTSAERLEPSSISDLRAVLREVGASIADVFGSDRIVWVEGQTEEECFRIVVEKLIKRSLFGTAIVAVRDTGSFESKRRDAKAIWEIYERLSHAQALLPPALAFSFDREGRTETEMKDLVRQSRGKVFFLPRRMLENYVLDADAITGLLNTLPSFRDSPTSAEAVSKWLDENSSSRLPKGSVAKYGEEKWLTEVHGGELLATLFQSLSAAREEFRKTEHVPALIAWLADKKPGSLTELAKHVERLLDADADLQ